MQLPVNAFKKAIGEGRPQIGLWSTLCSTIAAEAIAPAGFDWILIDMEHSPNELPGVVSQLQALQGGTATPIVRPPVTEPVMVKRLLDAGASNLLFPMVNSAEEAAAAVAGTRYPPHGIRGVSLNTRANRYGRVTDYLDRYRDELCVIVQIETRRAVGAIEAIAAVDGVDALFFGPADLSCDMGLIGKMTHPDVMRVLEDGARRCRAAGVPAGVLTVEAEAKRMVDMGFTFVGVGSDTALLARGADGLCQRVREAVKGS